MNLVLLEPQDVCATGEVTLTGARATHLLKVLGVAPGRVLRVGLVDGPRGTGTVVTTGDRVVTMWCEFETEPPLRPSVDLLLALPRPKVMRRLWAQLAALGVGRIMLTNAARVERNYFDTHVLAVEGYRPLLIEGLQQARDTRLPIVSIHRQLKVLIEDQLDGFFPEGTRVLADPSACATSEQVLPNQPGARLLLAIGPEGGWTDFERSLLGAHGFEPVGLGSRTLRTDTACVALLALAHRGRAF